MEALFSKKFNFSEFMKFVAPAILSMVFISLYTIIDGIFVSTLIGSDALASINITLPIINLIFGIAIMFGTGGSALVAIKLGEKKFKNANKSFSLLFIVAALIGILFSLFCFVFITPICKFLGATESLLPYCISYGRIIAIFIPIFIIKTMLEFFVRTDGNFNFSLLLSIIGGLINIIFDYVFIKILGIGIAGAALATGLGVLISALLGIWYFTSSKSTLKFTKPNFDFNLLRDTLINGSSEMVTELSTAITTLLFNMLTLKYAGENGVAALTIILYAHFLLVSTYLGFSSGIAPLISYNYGAKNTDKLKETYKYSKIFILNSSIIIFIIALLFSKNIVGIFVEQTNDVFYLALSGMKIFSFSFLFVGINIFASSLFTSFSNGKLSAIISFSRTFVFILIGAFILPLIFKINGIWLTVPFSEILTVIISILFIKKYKEKYEF
ncbi:MATE family efflux transporter [Clostridium tarantellae]|uniref:Multidrug export protein MepA n=1 Tax=Clostridium tarantellae TaxID=39493 RepID=A0A6I1MUD9_9CLOT|nr:MATE family efflux transporter [Clostridium tarantellae]MPQ43839.1 MATE family efflux transporter [Clostridium tarantellae]